MFREWPPVGVEFESVEAVRNYEFNQRICLARDKELLERLNVNSETRLLDLGCGTGALLEQAALLGATCTGVDVSENMISYARTRLVDLPGEVTLIRSGILEFDYKSNEFDVVIMRFVLHQLPDFWKQVAIDRVAKTLKPDGTFYLWDIIYSFPSKSYETEIVGWLERAGNEPGKGYGREDYEAHVRDEFSTFSWIIEGILERARLDIVNRTFPSNVHGEYTCVKPSR